MSKRFGRNQKRRMREALAAAEAGRQQEKSGRIIAEGIARETSRKLDDLRGHMAQFAERVGRYAIAEGVPNRLESDWLARIPRFRLPVAQRPGALLPMLRVASPMTTTAFCDEVMRVLDVDVIHDRMARDMHCRIYFDDHKVGYAISEHALRKLTRDELVHLIAPEIADMLIRQLKDNLCTVSDEVPA